MQLSSAAIKRFVLKRKHDPLSSSNKDFKTLMTNYNTNGKEFLLETTKHLLNEKKINDTSNKTPRLSNLKRVQFSSAVIKRPLLKRQPDTLTSSNKDFKALITNYNNNNKVLLSTSSFVSFPVSSLFVSSFTTKNHGNKRKNKDNDTKRKKDSCLAEKIEIKMLDKNSSNSTATKQLIRIEEQVKTKNKKNDDADIPIYLWLDKMNTFETISITKE